MVFGKQTTGWRVLALTMLLAGAGFEVRVYAQPGQSAQPAAASQQGIPDAPRPQALPELHTITPVGPALPSAPTAQTPATTTAGNGATVANADQTAPGTSLPASPAPAAADPDQGVPPEEGATPFKFVQNVNFVQVPFTVKDAKGKLVPGLTWRDVWISENGQRQRMTNFTVDPFPLSVALVIDQSIDFQTMEKVNNALGALQGAFTPYDEVAVFTYNSSVHEQTQPTSTSPYGFLAAQSARLGVIIDRSKAVGQDPVMGLDGPLTKGIVTNNDQTPSPLVSGNPDPSGGINLNPPKEFHPLNDAILAAAESLAHAAPGRRRIVYVISDGKEYGSTAKEKAVIKYCQTNKISIYATVVGNSAVMGLGFLDRMHLPLTMRDDILPQVTDATGGQYDSEYRQKGIETSFAKITEEVRTQYTVGYYSHEPMLDGKFRSIDVTVLRNGLTVIAEKGYYPTATATTPAHVTPSAAP